MGDPICKWRAARPHNVVELVNDILPHEEMPENDFYDIVDKRMPGFMHTPYQLAAQLGLYAVVDGTYYPRFKIDIDDEEATRYLENVVTKYYVPNPYTKRGFTNLDKPILLEKSIVEYLEKYPTQNDLEQILKHLIREDVGNFTATKTLLSYSKLFTIQGNTITLNPNYKEMEIDVNRNNKRAFFEIFNAQFNRHKINAPIQQILFGAPGTGKSHTINSDANITEQNSIRTTFHPDSDYSTFVGCYKPTKKEQSKGVLTPLNDLISISKEQSTTEQRVKFISKYAESIKAAAKENGLSDNRIIRDANYFGWNSDTYLMNFLNEILEERAKIDDSEITYDFTPQAFTNAYVAAWKDLDNPFYLIIEEINRGNCAQIFGDIFQLLDRDEHGYSSYKTTPDQDLANYIREQFTDTDIDDADVKSGKKMQLPPNLHIWATMNTSDQSLFPIDSAFKRRWDWRYIPIDYTDRGHYINCGDTQYSWADFLQKVNDRVESVTQSEDKKLGYWFMGNGAEQKEITIDRFVSKVVFYLWNDVFKDFGKSGNTIFKDSFAKFHLFFDFSGKPKVDVVKAFLDALEVKEIVINNEEYENSDIEESDSKGSPYTYKLDGVFIKGIGQVVRRTIEKLCQTMNFDDILNDFNSIVNKTYQNGSAMRLGTAQELGKDLNGRNRWWKDPFTSKDGKIFSVTALWLDSDFERLKSFVKHYPSIFPGGLVQEVAEQ